MTPATEDSVPGTGGSDASGSEAADSDGNTTDPIDQEAGSSNAHDGPNWPLLGLGGALGLCCLFAPATAGAVGGAAAGSATATAGGGLVQVAVSAATVAVLGAVLYAVRS